MIKESEILNILLLDAYKYQSEPQMVKEHLKAFVNNALDNSEWCDGFETAVKQGELDHYEYTELIDSIKAGFPNVHFDREIADDLIDEELPSFFGCAGSLWLTGDNFIIFSDELAVGKFQDNKFQWVTQRISIDGIELKEITETSVIGLLWDGSSYAENYGPNCPFEIDLKSGSLIKGEPLPEPFLNRGSTESLEKKKPWWKFW